MAKGHEEVVTVEHIGRRAWGFADALKAAGINAGDVVVIVHEHAVDLYAAFIGATLLGAVPTFLPPLTRKQDPDLHRQHMQALLARIEPAVVISSEASRSTLGWDGITLIAKDIVATEAIRRAPDLPSDTIALLQHSSGTTGLKKGVQLSHAQVISQANRYAGAVGLDDSSVIVSWLPLYHDMGLVTAFLIPALMGASVVSLDALEWVMHPTLLLDHLERVEAGFAWLPNFAFHHIMRLDRRRRTHDLSRVRALIDCSEPCRVRTLDDFAARYRDQGLDRGRLGACYAMAEAVFAVTQTSPGVAPRSARSCEAIGFASSGTPIAGCRVEVRGPDGRPMPCGGLGEVWLTSESLFNGYHRQPELASERLIDGWLRTGDLGVIEDSELFVVGRSDDLIIVNGRNLLAHEVEDVASSQPGVAPGRVFVYAEMDEATGTNRLCVAAELAQPNEDQATVTAMLLTAVETAAGVAPLRVQIVERGFLVKSSSGKIAREESRRKLTRASLHKEVAHD